MSSVLDFSDGHCASICRIGSEVSLEGNLCSSWSNFVHDIASTRYAFLLKNSTFHQIRTLFLEGPNLVKFFSFHKHHFFLEKKKTGS